MLLTEKAAKVMCCPFAINGARENERGELHIYCVTRSCMAWRWLDHEIETVEFYEMGMTPEGDGWSCTLPDAGREVYSIKSMWQRKNPERRGYCGLVGRPEE